MTKNGSSAKDLNEYLHIDGLPLDYRMEEYWRWAHSDLLSNTERGVLAEYIVGIAIGGLSPIRKEWEPFDIITTEGLKVEVKSAAYLQSWGQRTQSRIVFNIPQTRYWDSQKGRYTGSVRRQSDIYIFALLACKERDAVDPLNLSQWEFYILPTIVLDRKVTSQRTISLAALEKLGARKCTHGNLAMALRKILNEEP